MKRIISLVVSLVLAFGLTATLSACDSEDETLVLRIYNWEDYIADDDEDEDYSLLSDFVDWYAETHDGAEIVIEYSTFGTNEILYNDLKINPGNFDLVCPSDYMIQKMIKEDMLEPLGNGAASVPNYFEYGSDYMKDLFEENGWADYAIPYMWGTMGFVYNPDFVDEEDVSTWAVALNEKYSNRGTIKDSVRDTYFLGVALAKIDELSAKNEAFENGDISLDEYQDYLAETFNDTSKETVDAVQELLIKAKKNAYSLEVDDGKNDMATGKIWLNFAWSGDAVYTMDEAETSDTYLCYSVPKEGSNIWFDGWVIPKGIPEKNKQAALAFLDFLSIPENACLNMEYIGYTSAIAGDEVLEWVQDYGYACDPDDEDAVEIDVTYFFGTTEEGENTYIYTNDPGRQLMAQYPPREVVARCTVMQYFEDEANARINKMWNRVKAADNIWRDVIIISAVLAAGIVVFLLMLLYNKGRLDVKAPKGYKRVK